MIGQWHKTPTQDDAEIASSLTATDCVRNNTWQTYLPATFNPGGQPNASVSKWQLCEDWWYAASDDNNKCRVFEPPGRKVYVTGSTSLVFQAEHWTIYTALRSLIEQFGGYGAISCEDADWLAIETTLGTTPLPEVCVQGLSLLEAMRAILLPRFGFAIEPWRDELGSFHRLRVFPLDQPATKKSPNLADIIGGQSDVDSETGQCAQVQRLHFVRDNHNATSDITVIGDQHRLQVRLDYGSGTDSGEAITGILVPFWVSSPNALSGWTLASIFQPKAIEAGDVVGYDENTFATRYNKTGSDHLQYRHVWRSFCLNEDGCALALGHNIPDLKAYGDTATPTAPAATTNWIRRPRPLGPLFMMEHDSAGVPQRMAPRVRMAIVEDGSVITDSWLDVSPVRQWASRCGFTLGEPDLFNWYPWQEVATRADDEAGSSGIPYEQIHYLTLLNNTLEGSGSLRLMLSFWGSIETDKTLTAQESPTISADWPFYAKRVVSARGRFLYEDTLDDGGLLSLTAATTRQDSTAVVDFADEIAEASSAAVGHGSITLRSLTREYVPGVGIPATSGRVVDFDLVTNGSKYPIVVGVTWDFGSYKTELALDTPMLRLT